MPGHGFYFLFFAVSRKIITREFPLCMMLFSQESIRSVILFPQLKPK
jgi:hypothetical protein